MRRLLLLLRCSLVFSLLALAFPLSALAQAKRPFTFEDMMKLKRVGDPQVSPDGKWVIFSVVDVDLAANTKTPHIWIVPLSSEAGTAGVGKGHVEKARVEKDREEKARVGTGVPPVQAERSSAGSPSLERELIADQDT